jgi:EF-hand domain pair
MFPLMGAAGSALSILSSLLQSSTAGNTKSVGGSTSTSLAQVLSGSGDGQQTQAVAGSGQGAAPLSSGTLATLIALQGQSSQGQGGVNGQGGLFSQLDSDGDGNISQSEFENALGKAGVDTSSADALFNKLDANGDGSISQSEMAKARGHHHHHGGGGGQGGGLSSLLNSTDFTGASTKTDTNSDGSSSTTITYADGSTVTMTTPAAAQGQGGGTAGGNSNSSNQTNLLERLFKLQSQLTAQKGTGSTTSATA